MGYENFVFVHSDPIYINNENANFDLLKKICDNTTWEVVNCDEEEDAPTLYKIVCQDFSGYHPQHVKDLETIFSLMKEHNLKIHDDRSRFFCYKILVIGETLDSNYLCTVKPDFSLILQVSNYSEGTISTYSNMEDYRSF